MLVIHIFVTSSYHVGRGIATRFGQLTPILLLLYSGIDSVFSGQFTLHTCHEAIWKDAAFGNIYF